MVCWWWWWWRWTILDPNEGGGPGGGGGGGGGETGNPHQIQMDPYNWNSILVVVVVVVQVVLDDGEMVVMVDLVLLVVRYQIGTATDTSAKATGGAISFYGGKTIHTFTSSGTL